MAKQPVITDITTLADVITPINDNFDNVQAAFDNTLSRDGSTPNHMESDLDMNSNDILNAKDVFADRLYLGGEAVDLVSQDFDTRASFVTWVAGGNTAADGTVIWAEGQGYLAESGATLISDLGGFVPLASKQGVYPVECWGSPVTSAVVNTARAAIVAVAHVDAATEPFAAPESTILCTSDIAATDPIYLYKDGSTALNGINVDFSQAKITSTAGGTLTATTHVLEIMARGCVIKTPGIDCGDLSSGIKFTNCLLSEAFLNNPVYNYADGDGTNSGCGRAFTFSGNMSNSRVHGPQFYEEYPEKAGWSTYTNRKGIGLYVDAYDFKIYGGDGGWTRIPIYLASSAREVDFFGMHPFNGSPDEVSVIVDPTLIECDSQGDIYFYDSYLDNGLILDNTGGNLHITGGQFLELASAVTLTSPRMRVFCTAALNGQKPLSRIKGCEGLSVGYYNDAGVLSPAGSGNDWAGDLTSVNSFWSDQENDLAYTKTSRRDIEAYSGTDDIPVKQFTKAGGRHIWEWHSATGGSSSNDRLVFDPNNSQYRVEFSDHVVQGNLDVRRASGDNGSRGITLRSEGSFNAFFDVYNGATLKSHMFWDNVGARTVVGTTVAEPLVMRYNNADRLTIRDAGALLEGVNTSATFFQVDSNTGFNSGIDLSENGTAEGQFFWDSTNTRLTLGTINANEFYLRANSTVFLYGTSSQDVVIPNGSLEISTADSFGSGLQVKNTAGEILDFAFASASASANFNINYSGSGGTDITFRKSGNHSLNGNWGVNESSPDVSLHVDGEIKTNPVAVASLPSAATVGAGTRAFVNNANSTTFASVVAGGGSNNVPVYSDGTDWRIG